MLTKIHADYAVSITELKKNPQALINNAHGEAIALLNRNKPTAYIAKLKKQTPLRLAWMSYKLKFLPSALKEWRKLAPEIKEQFKAHLSRRLENPHIDSARIRGYKHHYKIKLRSIGYRLTRFIKYLKNVNQK
jgi:mRNA-degrading endonuclease RelE of RelBE toxin-antitoxin system